MKKATKLWLIVANALIVVGLLLLASVLTACQWEVSDLENGNFVTNIYEIHEDFSNLSVNIDTADIILVQSEDGACRVECYEHEKEKHSAAVQGDTLVIKLVDERAWYDYIGITFKSPKITVYLPETQYAALSVSADTGDIEVPAGFHFESADLSTDTGSIEFCASASGAVKAETDTGRITMEHSSVDSLDLSASTGRMTVSDVSCVGDIRLQISTGKTDLTNIRCKKLTSYGDTGAISLRDVVATESFSIKRDTGDVRLDACDAAEIYIETDTGDVEGSLLSDKIFFTVTDTGRVDVPQSMSGGRCEIRTDTGDIRISVKHS